MYYTHTTGFMHEKSWHEHLPKNVIFIFMHENTNEQLYFYRKMARLDFFLISEPLLALYAYFNIKIIDLIIPS